MGFIERRNDGIEARAAGHARVASLEEVSRVEKIMALASGQSEQDHPVCEDCLKHVVLEVERQVKQAGEEKQMYEEAHSRLENELRNCGDQDARALEAEITDMEAEERR